LLKRIVEGYRVGIYDAKLIKNGNPELASGAPSTVGTVGSDEKNGKDNGDVEMINVEQTKTDFIKNIEKRRRFEEDSTNMNVDEIENGELEMETEMVGGSGLNRTEEEEEAEADDEKGRLFKFKGSSG